jgi:hypothetical protein
MKPKREAKELVNTYYSLITGIDLSYVSKLIYLPNGNNNYEIAKNCALIAVDRILESLIRFNWTIISNKVEFWQEVKKEIQKL